ncbi:hypothetical protein H6P81_002075 [Aristolochia fimbriata]|uniref:Uncharacterized protein n=1 Tax=Aristolochia fimbriata TaxID=158543 RepID=A0AAV7F8S4_ARIFI|nr:hypothetical protein H6P81_002075 [Aristolochia fimbriata]
MIRKAQTLYQRRWSRNRNRDGPVSDGIDQEEEINQCVLCANVAFQLITKRNIEETHKSAAETAGKVILETAEVEAAMAPKAPPGASAEPGPSASGFGGLRLDGIVGSVPLGETASPGFGDGSRGVMSGDRAGDEAGTPGSNAGAAEMAEISRPEEEEMEPTTTEKGPMQRNTSTAAAAPETGDAMGTETPAKAQARAKSRSWESQGKKKEMDGIGVGTWTRGWWELGDCARNAVRHLLLRDKAETNCSVLELLEH